MAMWISTKIKSLKTQYSREGKNIDQKSKSEAGALPEDNIWFVYTMMSFLIQNTISRGSRSTIEVNIHY